MADTLKNIYFIQQKIDNLMSLFQPNKTEVLVVQHDKNISNINAKLQTIEENIKNMPTKADINRIETIINAMPQLDKIQQQINTIKTETFDGLNNIIDTLANKDDIEARLKKIEADIKLLNGNLTGLTQQYTDQQNLIQTLQNNTLQQQIDNINTELQQIGIQIAPLNNIQINDQIAEINKKLENIPKNEQFAENIQELNKQIALLQTNNQYNELSKQIENELAKITAVINSKANTEDLTKSINDINADIAKLNNSIPIDQYNKVTAEIAQINAKLDTFATRDELGNLATRDELGNLATKNELSNLATKDELGNLATKNELSNLATKDQLSNLATKNGLGNLATKNELGNLATKNELSNLATKDQLSNLATKNELGNLAIDKQTINDISNKLALLETAIPNQEKIKQLEDNISAIHTKTAEFNDQINNIQKDLQTIQAKHPSDDINNSITVIRQLVSELEKKYNIINQQIAKFTQYATIAEDIKQNKADINELRESIKNIKIPDSEKQSIKNDILAETNKLLENKFTDKLKEIKKELPITKNQDKIIDIGKNIGFKMAEDKLKQFGFVNAANLLVAKKAGIDTKNVEIININQDDKDTIESKNYKNGIYGDYVKCAASVNRIREKFTQNLDNKYTFITALSGGKSGAYVFLVKDKNERKFILKLYALKILNTIQDRDEREIFTTCALSGNYGFPVAHDFGTTQYNSESAFWKSFKESYIDCVPDNKKLKDHTLYTRVYYLVTAVSGGKELEKYNLLDFNDEELASILHQLAIIFKTAREKVPGFVHNDLHPGNIFIDSSYNGQVVYMKNGVTLKGPKVSIIDFDLVISDQYDENLAKGREYAGKFLVQEAMISLLNRYVGVLNTNKIINYTSRLWNPPIVENKDDFRLWYIYLVLFQIIVEYNNKKLSFGVSIVPETDKFALRPEINSFIDELTETNKFIYIDFPKDFPNKITELPAANKQSELRLNNNKKTNVYEKFLLGTKNVLDILNINIAELKSIELDHIKEFIKSFVGTNNPQVDKFIDFLLNSIRELDTEVYNMTRVHFGLHNYKLSAIINFGKKEILIPIYNKGNTLNITLAETTENRTVKIILDGNEIGVELQNIVFNKTLLIDKASGFLVNIVTNLFNFNIGKVVVNTKSGELKLYDLNNKEAENQELRNYLTWILNWGFQHIVKKNVNCPGIVFDKTDFLENMLPLILAILRYLYDTGAIAETTVTLSNKTGESVKKDFNIKIIEIIDAVINGIDNKIKSKILDFIPEPEQKKVPKYQQNISPQSYDMLFNDALINNQDIKFINNETYNKLLQELSNAIDKGDNAEINKLYNQIKTMKDGMKNKQIDNEIIAQKYKEYKGDVLDKYSYVIDIIAKSTNPDKDQYYIVLQKVFVNSVIEKSREYVDIFDKYKFYNCLYNSGVYSKNTINDIKQIIAAEIDRIVVELRSKLELKIEDTNFNKFFTHIISNRFKKQYPNIIANNKFATYSIQLDEEIRNLNNIYSIIELVKNGNSFENANLFSILYYTKDNTILAAEYYDFLKTQMGMIPVADQLTFLNTEIIPKLKQTSVNKAIIIQRYNSDILYTTETILLN